jgi:hypothetical protein
MTIITSGNARFRANHRQNPHISSTFRRIQPIIFPNLTIRVDFVKALCRITVVDMNAAVLRVRNECRYGEADAKLGFSNPQRMEDRQMADISVQGGYTAVAPAVREAVSHPTDAFSEQLFTILAIAGGLVGVAASTMIHVADPAITGLFCTILGSVTAALCWSIGRTVWQTTHPHHD